MIDFNCGFKISILVVVYRKAEVIGMCCAKSVSASSVRVSSE